MRPSAFNQPIPLPFLVAGMAIYPKLFNLSRRLDNLSFPFFMTRIRTRTSIQACSSPFFLFAEPTPTHRIGAGIDRIPPSMSTRESVTSN
jgi:hypothetical protein